MANVYKTKMDIKNIRPNFTPMFVQYDHARLEIELLDNGRSYDLSTADRVEFTHVRSDDMVITHPGEIVTNGNKKILRYKYRGSEMDLLGLVEASFAVFDADNKKVSSHAFSVEIRKDLRDEQFNPAQPNYGLLQTLINDVEELKVNGGGGGGGGIGPKGEPGYTPVKGVDYFDGIDGKSAFEIAVENGFIGSETEWLESLKGEQGPQGERGLTGEIGYTPQKNIDYFDGVDGVDGKSAYQIAVSNGFVGTEAEWLASIKGAKGDTGLQGPPGSDATVISANITTALGYTPIKAGDVTWANVLSKPSTFTPSTHTHDWSDVSNKPTTFSPTNHTHLWSEITGKPTTFTPATHTHSYSDLTNKPSIPSLNNTALTGAPTAPTAAIGTNTTQIANTAFVKAVNDAHKTDVAPHQYGGKFEWRYNVTTNSLDLVVL